MHRLKDDESGFILIAVLVTLMLLVVIGFSATSTTTVEMQIAGNDKVHKRTFYEADGGTEVGGRMIEENVSCPAGFTGTEADGSAIINGIIAVDNKSLTYWKNTTAVDPSDTSRDLFYPQDYDPDNGDPHTNITIGGTTKYLAGSAIQMIAGYEGKGKGAAAGGAYIDYDIISQRLGDKDSTSEIQVEWRHVVGLEGDCNY